jgi:UDP-glucose 4-epimerase
MFLTHELLNIMSTILVTGAAGYIGTHTVIELLNIGHNVIALDNFCNSNPEALNRVNNICGKAPLFHHVDIRDRAALMAVFSQHSIDVVIHFAALKSVAESVSFPLRYYQNNIGGTLNLLSVMRDVGVRSIVFSSSATVYADANGAALTEDSPLGPSNPYGSSKLMMENIMRDLASSEPGWHIALLRYFNPVGAHESGQIGEAPCDIPNNLMPYICQVASGKLQELKVFGGDYPTPDGTGVRDFIHVVDLAKAHAKTIDLLNSCQEVITLNLGTGRGYSVLQLINAFSQSCGIAIPYEIVSRRQGDLACCYADPSKAEKLLKWKAEKNLEQMCSDSWHWQSNNPLGYSRA